MVDMKLRAVIDANTKGFKDGMKDVSRGLTVAGGKLSRFGYASTASFAAIQVAAVAASAAIVGAFAVKSTKAFIAFEDSLTKTAAIMGADSIDAIQGVRAEIEDLGATTRSTALEVSDAAQILALAGLKEEDLVEGGALRNLNQLSIAAGVDLPTAAGVAIASLKGMGMETEELTTVNDVLLQTMTNSFTSLETLGETMKMLAPTAKATGISLEEAAAAAGALGNAGIQGTMAGTGMRMAINKLIKPTEDARRVINDLGINVFTLTPAGEAAKNALVGVQSNLDRTRADAEATTTAMKMLTAELTDMSIEQQKNNVEIMKIRQRAEKQGRELTDAEIAQIDRLEMANDDLNITMAERRIEQAVLGREQDRLTESISTQEAEFKSLNDTVSAQTMGLTSLSDVFAQLSAAGATTAQIMEIFGIRGGNAVNAIMAQGDEFERLIALNQDAEGRTASMAEMMGTTTYDAVQQLNSAFTALMLSVGEQFAPMVKDELVPALIGLIQDMEPLIPVFADLGSQLGEVLPDIIESFIPLIITLGENIDSFAGLLQLVAFAARVMGFFMLPLIQLLGNLGNAVTALLAGDLGGFFDSAARAVLDLAKFLMPVFRMVQAIAGLLGFDVSEGSNLDMAIGATATGAAIGSVIPGVGTIVGGGIGLAAAGAAMLLPFAEGGVVNSPTQALIGEAGPEAVIPLDRLDRMMDREGSQSGTSGSSIVINGGIHIGEGNNLNRQDVKNAIEEALPAILQRANVRGARSI